MRVLSGETVAWAKLQIPRKQIIPVVINGNFIIFILNYLTVLQGKIIALSLMLLWFGRRDFTGIITPG